LCFIVRKNGYLVVYDGYVGYDGYGLTLALRQFGCCVRSILPVNGFWCTHRPKPLANFRTGAKPGVTPNNMAAVLYSQLIRHDKHGEIAAGLAPPF